MSSSAILFGVAFATFLVHVVSAHNMFNHPSMCVAYQQRPMRQNRGMYAVPLVRDLETGCAKNCYAWPNSTDYRGTVAVTISGAKCQNWNSDKPHKKYKITNADFEKYGLQKNYFAIHMKTATDHGVTPKTQPYVGNGVTFPFAPKQLRYTFDLCSKAWIGVSHLGQTQEVLSSISSHVPLEA